jgi:hypothetical protein
MIVKKNLIGLRKKISSPGQIGLPHPANRWKTMKIEVRKLLDPIVCQFSAGSKFGLKSSLEGVMFEFVCKFD